jgi:hypothetical protein
MRMFAMLIAVIFVVGMVAEAEAKGRKGSTRVGGYTSHGKGSHYIGGRR